KIGNALDNNIMPHGLTGSFSGGATGNVILNATAGRQASFDLNGSTQTINGLSNTATNVASNLVTSSAAGGLLIVGDSNATSQYDGNLQNGTGTLALQKIGTGTLTLTGANTYTGNTSVNAGTLALGSSLTSTVTVGVAGTLSAGLKHDTADAA